MLPKNKLRDRRLERLRIFPGNETGILGVNVLRTFQNENGKGGDDGHVKLSMDWNPTKVVKESGRIMTERMVDKSTRLKV
jgi:large subunit ribosomal protein L13